VLFHIRELYRQENRRLKTPVRTGRLHSSIRDEIVAYRDWVIANGAQPVERNKVDGDRARWMVGHAAKGIDAKHYLEHHLPELIEAIEDTQ
jgi:hypothetical protein